MATRTSAFDLGAFGAALRGAPTIGEYVAAAIGGIGAATRGEQFWLEGEGSGLRLLDQPMSAAPTPLVSSQCPSSPVSAPPMPDRFIDRLDRLIRALLPSDHPDIRYVAALAAMSPRTLQPRLAERGLTSAGTVMQCRLAMAREWLAHSDLRITDIAAKLSYGDASNFGCALRTRVGVSPQAFRARSAGSAEVRATPSA